MTIAISNNKSAIFDTNILTSSTKNKEVSKFNEVFSNTDDKYNSQKAQIKDVLLNCGMSNSDLDYISGNWTDSDMIEFEKNWCQESKGGLKFRRLGFLKALKKMIKGYENDPNIKSDMEAINKKLDSMIANEEKLIKEDIFKSSNQAISDMTNINTIENKINEKSAFLGYNK